MTKNTEKTRLDPRTPPRPEDIDVIPEPKHPSRLTRYINKLLLLSLLIIALGVGVFLKWSFQDTNILVVNNSPFPTRVVSDPTGETGGIVFMNADYCKNSTIEGSVRMSYVSKSREVFLPVVPERMPKSCNKTNVPVIIPKELPKDTYKIKFHVIYNVNPLKKNISVDFESQEFMVGSQ